MSNVTFVRNLPSNAVIQELLNGISCDIKGGQFVTEGSLRRKIVMAWMLSRSSFTIRESRTVCNPVVDALWTAAR